MMSEENNEYEFIDAEATEAPVIDRNARSNGESQNYQYPHRHL